MDWHQHPFAWYKAPSSHPTIPQDPREASLTSTVPNQVQELLFLAAGLTVPTGESEVGVTGDTVRFQGPMALPAGWVAFWGEG